MEELSIVFGDVLYLTRIDDQGVPTILASGRPAESPDSAYREAAPGIGQNAFTCQRCHAAVASLLTGGKAWQVCRCMVVQHHCYPDSQVYQNSETWEAFRQIYERESLDPAPVDSLYFDPFSGKPRVSKKSRDFLTRKLGFHQPIEISQGGYLTKTAGGSIFIDPKTKTISTNLDKTLRGWKIS
jgi:hypothetical protein